MKMRSKMLYNLRFGVVRDELTSKILASYLV